VVVASATDPENARLRAARATSADLFDAAAAERADLERRGVAVELRRVGAEVVERPPADLAPALAATYPALKAAGRPRPRPGARSVRRRDGVLAVLAAHVAGLAVADRRPAQHERVDPVAGEHERADRDLDAGRQRRRRHVPLDDAAD